MAKHSVGALLSSGLLLSGLALAGFAMGGTPLKQNEPMTSVSVATPSKAHAGKTLNVKITLDVPEGYHIYSPVYKGDTGIPVSVKATGLPAGFSLKALKAPAGETLVGKVVLSLPISIAKSVHGKKSFKLKVRYQQCNDRICLPPQNSFATVTTSVG